MMERSKWEVTQEAERRYWQSWIDSESKERQKALRSYWRWYLDFVAQYVPLKRENRILDIGSGPDGIINYVNADQRFALDSLMDFYSSNFELSPEVVWKKGVMENIPFTDGYFDIVFTTNTLDHTWQPEKGLREIRRVLKNGGFLVLTVNCCGPLHKLYRLFKEKIGRADKYHPHTFSPNEVIRLISDVGFTMLVSRKAIGVMGGHYFNMFNSMSNNRRFNLKYSIANLIFWLENKIAGHSLSDFIFIGKKE